MHLEALQFLQYASEHLNTKEMKGHVIDIGSGDINGTNKWMFPNMKYVGCDVVNGPNVDIAYPCHELPLPDGIFDVVVSSSCFEHDMHWEKSIARIMKLLKPDGLFLFTVASTGYPEHGTRRAHGWASLHTRLPESDWHDYYRNLTADDIRSVPGFVERFPEGVFYYNELSYDLYFSSKPIPEYVCPGVSRV